MAAAVSRCIGRRCGSGNNIDVGASQLNIDGEVKLESGCVKEYAAIRRAPYSYLPLQREYEQKGNGN